MCVKRAALGSFKPAWSACHSQIQHATGEHTHHFCCNERIDSARRRGGGRSVEGAQLVPNLHALSAGPEEARLQQRRASVKKSVSCAQVTRSLLGSVETSTPWAPCGRAALPPPPPYEGSAGRLCRALLLTHHEARFLAAAAAAAASVCHGFRSA